MAEALARAKRLRAEAVEAQAARLAADKARTLQNAERAKEHGLVEKTAGESGIAGSVRNKWVDFLASELGADIAARLAAGGAPTVQDAKDFSSWVYSTRKYWSRVGRTGIGDSMGLRQIPYMLAKFVFPLMGYERGLRRLDDGRGEGEEPSLLPRAEGALEVAQGAGARSDSGAHAANAGRDVWCA